MYGGIQTDGAAYSKAVPQDSEVDGSCKGSVPRIKERSGNWSRFHPESSTIYPRLYRRELWVW